MSSEPRAITNIEVFNEWQRCLATNDEECTAKVVDLENYTEICLGLTPWTTGYGVAAANFYRNMIAPWADISFNIEDLQESPEGVTVRQHIEATHVGEFLGIPPTGKRVAWDNVAIVKVKGGKVVGQWAQPDLWGIYRQLAG